MLELPRRPEGSAEERIEALWELIYRIIEEIKLMEERDT